MQSIINKEEAIIKLKNNDIDLSNCSDELRNDFDVVYTAVLSSGDNLEFASDNQKCDKEIILKSINDDIDNFKFSSESIKNDKDFILTILTENAGPGSYFFSYISDALISCKYQQN